MAQLTNDQRRDIWAEWMRINDEPVSITKADLRAAFNALDGWLETNKSAINSAIPQPARGELSARQKAWILARVIEQRFKVGA
jgi:hypothetical protein